ncbi:hypothetical protein A5N78_04700 [Prescottella equi]|uniref:hypothetical protein n=1 Tax=Rhodococcus hoagii TaxID=43767 RepID=UPI000A114B98|nr:hypothetical protein [Prescottella equi]ORL93438.1 hypothetical protein A5N78_04700 [Prescottella equi]ORM17791.1 hypothetical protein A5N70_11275 [Prescottella equi]
MTNAEIAISQPTALPATPGPLSISGALAEQVQQMSHAYTLAQSLCKTALVPQVFRGKPEDGAVAIMAGAKWGLDAVASLQNIFIVHGAPSTYARVMKAVVQANGHEIWTEAVEPNRVVVCGRRKDTDKIERSEWTADRARKAGYFSNRKYETELENMLYARATAEACRRTAPDCLLGMPYAREEMEDARPVRATAQRMDGGESGIASSLGLVPAAEPTPVDVTDLQEAAPEPQELETEAATEPVDAVPMITTAQLKKLHVVLGKEGVTTDAAKYEWLTSNLHREITSSKQVTRSEAAELIDYLEGEQAKDAAKAKQ